MKKTLLSAMLVFLGLAAQAQAPSGIPNGSIAPDFTANDINGVSHHLYEYLDAGKTVIIDVSATWCGPCWNYHNTDALADLYQSFGMGGSEDVVVLFIEGDPGTSVESIYGTNTPDDRSVTQGNWTEHSPYPIIDDTNGNISDDYGITAFPTIFMICPETRATKLLSQPNAVTLKNQINNNCAATPMIGVNDKAMFTDLSAAYYCDADGAYKAKFKNLGSNRITSATIVLKENGTVLSTKQYTNTNGLTQYSSTGNITFDNVNFTANSQHTVEVTNINGITPPFPESASEDVDIQAFHSVATERNLEVRVYTDSYPGEISWKIRSSSGTVVATGGPYRGGTAPGEGGFGGPDANTTISTMVTLPEGDDCYRVELRDSYGDGWVAGLSGDEVHGLEIFNGNNSIFQRLGGNIGSQLVIDAALKTGTVAGTIDAASKHFAMYPNPTKGILNFTTQETIDVIIMDLTGKVVQNAKGINNGGSIDVSGLQSGMYIAQIKGATTQTTQKVIVE